MTKSISGSGPPPQRRQRWAEDQMQNPNQSHKHGGRHRLSTNRKCKSTAHARLRVPKNEKSDEFDNLEFQNKKITELIADRGRRMSAAEATIILKSWKKLGCYYEGIEELELRYP